MTEAIYTEVSAKVEASKVTKRRVSTSGMLKFLGVSRSGYHAFLNRKVSSTKQRKEAVKKEIQKIYDSSKQNYGAPKVTKELRKSGETIAQRTVGKYMREMGIKAQWIKPWTTTTRDSDFSDELHNILDEQFNPERPNAVWCTDINYIWTQDGFVYLTALWTYFPERLLPGLFLILWKCVPLSKQSIKQKLVETPIFL
ncbi:IS3 family transposase [Anaerocolumna sp. AGMB13020]|uniref:IS3 family transposase n=1 Tax=Anaerocolumna sp. AGMB13020 TaxID=3081750 RepID=UPI002955957E|nr:IS3 family transposase [Anaerocolumna sp. AGMB13020]WOO36596.1 IS3 family transposase [Anaerocolumna sp. AGMB13020]